MLETVWNRQVKISIRIVNGLRDAAGLPILLQSRLVHNQEVNSARFKYFLNRVPSQREEFIVALCLQNQLHLHNSLRKLT